MKRILTLAAMALVFVVCLLTGPAQSGERPSGDGLVAFWDFNGRLLDRAGEAEDHCAAQDGKARFVSTDDLPGTIDGALALGVESGDATFLTAKVSPDVQLGPSYTIEAWIHPTHVLQAIFLLVV